MQAIYCTECGSKNIYSGSKPKFCSSCGHPIGVSTKEKKVSNLRKKPDNRTQASLVEGETDIDYVPSISSLEYEISDDGSLGSKAIKVGDIFNAQESQGRSSRRRS